MTDNQNIYSEYPDAFASIAIKQEAHVIAALSEGPAALRVQLPQALAEYQTAALALLHVVTTQQAQPSRRTVFASDFICDLVGERLKKLADVYCANAVTRTERANYYAAKEWNDAQAAAHRSQRLSVVSQLGAGEQ